MQTAIKSIGLALTSALTLGLHPLAGAQTTNQTAEMKESAPPAAEKSPKASDADLAKELQNPVAGVISVPLESRVDFGPGSTWRYTLSLMPVLPFEVTFELAPGFAHDPAGYLCTKTHRGGADG